MLIATEAWRHFHSSLPVKRDDFYIACGYELSSSRDVKTAQLSTHSDGTALF